MSNYKENKIQGEITSWRRARAIRITNNYEQIPEIEFYEEEKTLTPNQVLSRDTETLKESFANPLEEFDLIHPELGIVVGKAKYQDIYIMLYSLYIKLADRRDNPPVPPVIENNEEIPVE
jgi:hypothetical protein